METGLGFHTFVMVNGQKLRSEKKFMPGAARQHNVLSKATASSKAAYLPQKQQQKPGQRLAGS